MLFLGPVLPQVEGQAANLLTSRKRKKDVEKVETPKADIVVPDLYEAGWRAYDNHANKYRYYYSQNKYPLLCLPSTFTLYICHHLLDRVAVSTILKVFTK